MTIWVATPIRMMLVIVLHIECCLAGSPVQEWWSGKARDRLDFTTVKAYLDNNVPTHEVISARLLDCEC